MVKNYFEDYHIGEILQSPGRTITETDIVLFASLTGDWWEGHTNVEFAGKMIFGQRIAHGMLTLCVGTSLLFRLGDNVFLPQHFIANYGIDKLRYTAPVMIGDTIKCTAEVIQMDEKDVNRGILTYAITIFNQRDDEVLTYIAKVLVRRQASE